MGAKVDGEGCKGSCRAGAVRNRVDEMQGHVD